MLFSLTFIKKLISMKNLCLLLLCFLPLLSACNDDSKEAVGSDQAIAQDKLEAIRDLVRKYELPDSVFQNIARLKEEKTQEFNALDLQTFEEQLANWAAFKKSLAPHQEEMKEMSEIHRKAWTAIESETDPDKKAALIEQYWKETFPKLEERSRAIQAQQERQQ
jgi:hypothetical protein